MDNKMSVGSQQGPDENKCCQTNLISHSGLQWSKEKASSRIYLDFSHALDISHMTSS